MKSYFESKSPAQSKNSNSSNRGKKRHVLQSIPIIMICEVRLIRRYSHLLLHFDIFEGGVTVFDYFGEDYKVSGSEQIVRKSKQLVYRNH